MEIRTIPGPEKYTVMNSSTEITYLPSIPGRSNEEIFSLRHRVQTGSGAKPASYPMGTRGSFPEGKAAGA
jgi:hypothetical protein